MYVVLYSVHTTLQFNSRYRSTVGCRPTERQRASHTGVLLFPPSPPSLFPLPFLLLPLSTSLPSLPFNPAKSLGECCKFLNSTVRSPATKRILVHLEVNMKRFKGQISCIFQQTEIKGRRRPIVYCYRFVLCLKQRTTQSIYIMLPKIVHRTRDCVGLPCYWGPTH